MSKIPSLTEKRNITIGLWSSIIFPFIYLLLIISRYIFFNVPSDMATLSVLLISLFPLALNYFKFYVIGRIAVAWAPVLTVYYVYVPALQAMDSISSDLYHSMKIFLLGLSVIPFLVFDTRNRILLLIGVLPTVVGILFTDQILDFFNVGPSQVSANEISVRFNSLRTIIAFIATSASCLSLRFIVDRSDQLNQKLISELEQKNKIIRDQASGEVNQLNEQLMLNLDDMIKREFILRQAQEIAKMGSWEYNLEDKTMLWSDNLYSIFEIDKRFNFNNPKANELLFGDAAKIISEGFLDLVHNKNVDIVLEITTPKGIKWVRILAYPTLNNNEVTGASGIIHDITYFKESEKKVAAGEKNYRSLFDQASDAIMITDDAGKFLDVNASMCTMLGYSKDELLQLNVHQIIDPEQLQRTPIRFKELLRGEQVINERMMLRKNGSKVHIEANVKKFGDNKLMAIARDITERKQTALKLLKYIRELALLNTINVTTSQTTNVYHLLDEMCNVLTVEGGYKLVWIAQLPPSTGEQIVKPLITKGDRTDYVKDLTIDLQREDHQKGPTAQALLLGKTTIINQIANDTNYEVWRSKAVDYGFYSSLAMCIDAEPETRYALNVYSDNPDSFDEAEVSILQRIVVNVASAIKSIRATHERDQAKRELQRTYERLSYHITNTPLAVIERDKDFKISYWNKRAEELFGWRAEEIIGKKSHDFLVSSDDTQHVLHLLEEIRDQNLTSRFKDWRNITKDGKPLYCQWYYSMLRDENGNLETILSFVSDVTEQTNNNYLLNERIKELTTLYKVSQFLSREPEDIEDLFTSIAEVLPLGWQYPEICAARIQYCGVQVSTDNFNDSPYEQIAPLKIHHEQVGFIKIVYLEERPQEIEGPFYAEERNLLDIIAEMLQIYLERKQEQGQLNKAQANLRATMNNTEIRIWSLDRDYNLITFNEPSEQFNKTYHNIQLKPGLNHQQFIKSELIEKWEERYLRVLTGEIVVFEETVDGFDFKYSLSPIIENKIITGISVFADDVTERNTRGRELVEANKNINSLKIMALRSVMNPHFIFNVLSSIQYFITRNDQLNAINYLTSFSKLMRMVLTRSVADTISLKEEIEMIENYVSLERLRFENKFDFFVECEESLDTDTIRIPSLLIQPYVENAILHGLYNKEGYGKLTIRMRAEDEYLLFEIEDDGIGREAAAKLKKFTQQTQKSLGTKLTEERLKLLNADAEVAVIFKDLYIESDAAGTIVQIRIKLYQN